jgi:hypothetical protein
VTVLAWDSLGSGVTLAHERARRLAPRAPASDQLPLVLVMIVFTIGGLGLLFGF